MDKLFVFLFCLALASGFRACRFPVPVMRRQGDAIFFYHSPDAQFDLLLFFLAATELGTMNNVIRFNQLQLLLGKTNFIRFLLLGKTN